VGDDNICQDLDDNFFKGIVAFGKAVEEEVEVVSCEILCVVSIDAFGVSEWFDLPY
jgi:hypothetical protein